MSNIEFPILNVRMVDINKVVANDYNPNKVMSSEMELLKKSIEEDGYTQPIVTFYDKDIDKYIIIDGFHRYRCAKEFFDLKEIPIVTIDKPLSNRIASTIRHNRARGVHQTIIMSDIVKKLIKLGKSDKEIQLELGMDPDELLRMKQIMKVDEFFANDEYVHAWIVNIRERKDV